MRMIAAWSIEFLSTPSARRATSRFLRTWQRAGISIHALREEGDQESRCTALTLKISIHALREEGDYQRQVDEARRIAISIHALREEGDKMEMSSSGWRSYFYPRPPRGGRQGAAVVRGCLDGISIHALREEGDLSNAEIKAIQQIFLSTPSARRAT